MEVTPQWVGVVLTALGMGAAAGVWLEKRLQVRRDVLPLVRASWKSGAAGHAVKVTLVNRLNEDLRVERAEARTRLVEQSLTYDAGGSIVNSELVPQGRSVPLKWDILVGESGTETFRLEGADSARWLQLTISSSARTLRSRRLIVKDSQKP